MKKSVKNFLDSLIHVVGDFNLWLQRKAKELEDFNSGRTHFNSDEEFQEGKDLRNEQKHGRNNL